MRDENQCLHGRDAHAPLAFASHTLSSHFRISEVSDIPVFALGAAREHVAQILKRTNPSSAATFDDILRGAFLPSSGNKYSRSRVVAGGGEGRSDCSIDLWE